MADELTLGCSLTYAPGGNVESISRTVANFKVSVSGVPTFNHIIQNIGTTKEVLDLGEVSTPGYVFMRNQDATNYVDVFPDGTGAAVVRLYAGEIALFRCVASAPQAQANTAAVDLEMALIPN